MDQPSYIPKGRNCCNPSLSPFAICKAQNELYILTITYYYRLKDRSDDNNSVWVEFLKLLEQNRRWGQHPERALLSATSHNSIQRECVDA